MWIRSSDSPPSSDSVGRLPTWSSSRSVCPRAGQYISSFFRLLSLSFSFSLSLSLSHDLSCSSNCHMPHLQSLLLLWYALVLGKAKKLLKSRWADFWNLRRRSRDGTLSLVKGTWSTRTFSEQPFPILPLYLSYTRPNISSFSLESLVAPFPYLNVHCNLFLFLWMLWQLHPICPILYHIPFDLW